MDDVSSETCLVLKNEFKKHRVVHQSNNNYNNNGLYFTDKNTYQVLHEFNPKIP